MIYPTQTLHYTPPHQASLFRALYPNKNSAISYVVPKKTLSTDTSGQYFLRLRTSSRSGCPKTQQEGLKALNRSPE